ncbi:GntR family transcriptional regulator [Klebsiella pneumoniae]|nr:GntR family transcriptional regulator [Klebsiella pneumoniae]
MFPSTSDSRLPRYQQLRDRLIDDIARNRWRPGEAVPTEAALASEFSLSTGTVRKAIDLLVTEGILEKHQGRGTFVRRPQFSSSLFRFFRFQTPAGEKTVPESRILSFAVQDAPSAVAEVLNIGYPNPQAIRILRLRTVAGTPLLHEEIWLPCPLFSALKEVYLHQDSTLLYPLYERHCGQVVASADETLTAEAVDEGHARIMQIPPGSPIVVIERVARNFAGQPLEWRRSRGQATYFSYSVQIR